MKVYAFNDVRVMAAYDQKMDEVLAPEQPQGGWPWKIFLVMATAFGIVAAGYIGLSFGYRPYLSRLIAGVNKDIDNLALSLPLEEQQKFLAFYSQIVNVKALLEMHVSLDKLFDFLEKNTNKHVSYETFQIDTTRRELTIDGITDSYVHLAEQLQAFDQAREVQHAMVQQSRVSEGKLRFRLNIGVAPDVLK